MFEYGLAGKWRERESTFACEKVEVRRRYLKMKAEGRRQKPKSRFYLPENAHRIPNEDLDPHCSYVRCINALRSRKTDTKRPPKEDFRALFPTQDCKMHILEKKRIESTERA